MTKATKTKGRKQPANVVLGKSDDPVWGFFQSLTSEQLDALTRPSAKAASEQEANQEPEPPAPPRPSR